MTAPAIPAIPAFAAPPAGEDGIAAALAEGRPAMVVERPDIFGSRRATAPLEVTGWAWSGAGIESVTVAVDDEDGIVVEALHDLFRPDLRRLLGDDLATSGFAVRIDARDWTPGAHKLTIVATDRDNRAIGVSGTVDSVAPGPPPATGPDQASEPPASERDARYRWAAPLLAGADVLDAGHAAGRGTAPLAEHARRVASHRGDPLELPFADDEFDAVVCFETMQHLAEPDRALDELQRVLRPQGLLLVSSVSDGLRAALEARFADVAIHRQQTYVASLLCDDRTLRHDDPREPIPTTTTKATATTPGDEPHTIATATDGRPPAAAGNHLALGERAPDDALRMWQHRAVRAEIDLAVSQMDVYWEHHQLGTERIERAAARERQLEERLATLERERELARAAHDAIRTSASWRATAALRRLAPRRRR
jgi:SAM-dependent methyltransferase